MWAGLVFYFIKNSILIYYIKIFSKIKNKKLKKIKINQSYNKNKIKTKFKIIKIIIKVYKIINQKKNQ